MGSPRLWFIPSAPSKPSPWRRATSALGQSDLEPAVFPARRPIQRLFLFAVIAALGLGSRKSSAEEGQPSGRVTLCGTTVRLDVAELDLTGGRCLPTDFERLGRLKALRKLTLSGQPLGDRDAKNLSGLSTLEELLLDGTKITNRGLQHLKALGTLTTLDTSRNVELTGSGLAHLSGLPLKRLTLSASQLTDIGLTHLGALGALERLETDESRDGYHGPGCQTVAGCFDLGGGELTARGLAHLRGLKVRHLRLDGAALTDASLRALSKISTLSSINCLEHRSSSGGPPQRCYDLSEAEGITLAGVRALKRLGAEQLVIEGLDGEAASLALSFPGLRSLNCRRCLEPGVDDCLAHEIVDHCVTLDRDQVGAKQLERLAALDSIEELSLPLTREHIDSVVAVASRLKGLKRLNCVGPEPCFDLSDFGGDQEALSRLLAGRALSTLTLSGEAIDDGSLVAISKIKGLRTLDLGGTKITALGLGRALKIATLESLTAPPGALNVAVVPLIASHKRLRSLSSSRATCDLRCTSELGCVADPECWERASQYCERACAPRPGELTIDLNDSALTAEGLSKLRVIPRKLRLILSDPGDDEIGALFGLPNIRSLNSFEIGGFNLSGDWGPSFKMTAKALDHLTRLPAARVKSLSLPEPLLTDEALAVIGRLTSLESLNAPLGERGAFHLGRRITRRGLEQLRAPLKLEQVGVHQAVLTDENLPSLLTLPGLRSLNCGAATKTGSPTLECISLNGGSVTSAGLRHLPRLEGVRHLELPPEALDDGALAALVKAAPGLRTLNCFYDSLRCSSDEVPSRCAVPSCFDLRRTRVTEAGLQALGDLGERPRRLLLPSGFELTKVRSRLPGVTIYTDEEQLLEAFQGAP